MRSRFYITNQDIQLVGNHWVQVERKHTFKSGDIFEVVESDDKHYFKIYENDMEIEITYHFPNGSSSEFDKSILIINSIMLQNILRLVKNGYENYSVNDFLNRKFITDITDLIKLQKIREEKINKLI